MNIKDLLERNAVKKVDSLISRSTVYRTMNLLVDSGLADEISFSGDRKYFESTSKKKHHDHFFEFNTKM